MTDLVKYLRDCSTNEPYQDDADKLWAAADRISQQDAELERLRREVEEAKEFRVILEGHLAAAIDDYNEARKVAFIEAAEIAEKQAPKAVRVFHEEANITPPVLKAAFEILASTLRAKAEETKP